MIGFGIYIADFISEDSTNRYTLFDLHKSIGVLVLILLSFRVINRFINRPPALPQTIKKLERILAHLGHLGLYILMLIVPLSGYLMSNSYGFEVKFFGILMPYLTSLNVENAKIFSEVHEISAYILAGLIAIHIIAVIKHRFFDQKENDVLNRML